MKKIVFFIAGIVLSLNVFSQSNSNTKLNIGAYYFDGWSGAPTQNNITNLLVKNYQERESIWGWITSTPASIKDQIDLAADAGLNFFDFCWYYPENLKDNYTSSPYNQALGLFLNAPNNNRLKYCIVVCNQKGYTIGPEDWDKLTAYWIGLFKTDRYLKFDGKPYITFLNVTNLVSRFGSTDAVKNALNDFRASAVRAGLKGVSIAGCATYDNHEISQALNCGFDAITGYNYHQNALPRDTTSTAPIDNLIAKDYKTWDNISNCFKIPYIPTASLNFDARPQARNQMEILTSKRYTGFSEASVYRAVNSLKTWLNNNPQKTAYERMGVIYAWNEYGEGAWLTPSKNQKENLLDGVKSVLKQ